MLQNRSRSLRPHGLIEERARWPCAGRQGSMPTRRRRALNSKLLPSRKLRWCLGYQETKLSTHQSILMEYLLKCKQTQQSLCRPEAATYHDDASHEKKSAHQTLNTLESTERIFFFFFATQRITWIWTNPQLIKKDKVISKSTWLLQAELRPAWPGGEEKQWRWGHRETSRAQAGAVYAA